MVLLLEDLNIRHFLMPGVMFRGSDVELQQLKTNAVQHRHIIRNYLGVADSKKMSAFPLIQTLLRRRRKVKQKVYALSLHQWNKVRVI